MELFTCILLIHYFIDVISCHPSNSDFKNPKIKVNGEPPEKVDEPSDTPIIESTTAIDIVADIRVMLHNESQKHPSEAWFQAGVAAGGMVVMPIVAILRTDLAAEKEKNLKSVILPTLRGEVEDYEQKYLPSINLDKSSMIKAVKDKDTTFDIPESIVRNVDRSIHYVRWRYILIFSTHPDIVELRTFLSTNHPKINDEAIAKALAMFYDKASWKIHDGVAGLSVGDIERGLKANGLEDRDMIDVIKALLFIPKGRKDELSTTKKLLTTKTNTPPPNTQ